MDRVLKISFFTFAIVICLGLAFNASAEITAGGGGVPLKPTPPKPPAKKPAPAKPAVDDKAKIVVPDPYADAKKEFDEAEAERKELEDEMNDLDKREKAGEDIRTPAGTWRNKARDAKKRWRKAKKEWEKQKKKNKKRYKREKLRRKLAELEEAKKKIKDKKLVKKLDREIKRLKAKLGLANVAFKAELDKDKALVKSAKLVNANGEDCMEVELVMLQELDQSSGDTKHVVRVMFNNINEDRIAVDRLRIFLTGPSDNQRTVAVKKDVATGRYHIDLGDSKLLDGYVVSVVTEGASAGGVALGSVHTAKAEGKGGGIIAALSGADDRFLISPAYGEALKKGLITNDQAKDMLAAKSASTGRKLAVAVLANGQMTNVRDVTAKNKDAIAVIVNLEAAQQKLNIQGIGEVIQKHGTGKKLPGPPDGPLGDPRDLEKETEAEAQARVDRINEEIREKIEGERRERERKRREAVMRELSAADIGNMTDAEYREWLDKVAEAEVPEPDPNAPKGPIDGPLGDPRDLEKETEAEAQARVDRINEEIREEIERERRERERKRREAVMDELNEADIRSMTAAEFSEWLDKVAEAEVPEPDPNAPKGPIDRPLGDPEDLVKETEAEAQARVDRINEKIRKEVERKQREKDDGYDPASAYDFEEWGDSDWDNEDDEPGPNRASVGSGQIGLGDNNRDWHIQYGTRFGHIRRMPTAIRQNAPLMTISIDCTYFNPNCTKKQNVVK